MKSEDRLLVQIPDLAWTSCVALDESPNLSASSSLKWLDRNTDVATLRRCVAVKSILSSTCNLFRTVRGQH